MKQFYLKTLVLLLICMVGGNAMAYDCEVDGIYYYLNPETMTAEVTYGETFTNSYSGDIVIPTTITYSENTYSVNSIGWQAFFGCNDLTSVSIPNSVNSIGDDAFEGCISLTSVTIPNSVTSIGNWAFSDCRVLPSITIPNSVTSIGERAFNYCWKLTSVTIPNSVTYIGTYAFSGCFDLTSITVESENTKYDSRNNCNAVIETATNTLVAGCKNTVIPNSVTSIGEAAFSSYTNLTSVTIPNSVTSIGEAAFEGCSLYSVTIPNSVTNIGTYAFANCWKLTSVTIPNSVTSIGEAAFAGCSALTSITVESGNTKYDSRNNCNSVIETVTNTLIAGCKNTVIPNSVTSIGGRAFSGCSGLTSVTIPNSVTTIGSYAFSYCRSLTSVTIPNSVTSIGYGAFMYCSSLTSVINLATTPPTCDSDVFNEVDKQACKLIVPTGSKAAYQNADVWKDFLTIEEGAETMSVASVKAGNRDINSVYSIDGKRLNGMRKDLNIIRMSDGTVRKVMVK